MNYYDNPGLGEAEVRPDLRDVLEPVQVLKEWRTWVTRNHKGEAYRYMCWLVYSKREVISYEAGRYEPLKPFGYFPQAPGWKLPAGTRQWGGARSDVWSTCLKLPVRQLLDEHAALTLDRPIPRYQMIVDPNQFVHQTRGGPVWVPCEFDISADGTASFLGGTRSHANPHLAQHVAGPVLSAALPLLAKLRRPQLLLDDRRLQVVFKAQRIVVPGDTGDNSDAEYVGLWHVDGHREGVAAVVLYYYHVDPSLLGGDMEFCGREPMDVLGWGDCSNNIRDLGSKSLQQALRAGSKSDKFSAVHNCGVPIGEGTLMVFSNYQMAHRVLRLKNTGSTEASRDFVALFLLDPSAPALLPARSILAGPHLLKRTLAPVQISESAMQNVLEFLGVSQTDVERKRQRNRLLSEQLQPSGEFACGGNVLGERLCNWERMLYHDRLVAQHAHRPRARGKEPERLRAPGGAESASRGLRPRPFRSATKHLKRLCKIALRRAIRPATILRNSCIDWVRQLSLRTLPSRSTVLRVPFTQDGGEQIASLMHFKMLMFLQLQVFSLKSVHSAVVEASRLTQANQQIRTTR